RADGLPARRAPRRAASVPDRLPPMLFLAALVHGILIGGITFNPLAGAESGAISLEVTIVAEPERSLEQDDDAAYLAQATQEGAGNTLLEVRPGALPDTDAPFENRGEAQGNSLTDTQAAEAAADQLLATSAEQASSTPDLPREDPEQRQQTALALEKGV